MTSQRNSSSPSSPVGDAADAVAREMRRHVIAERLRLRRLYLLQLQASIAWISPVAVDLAAHGGFTLEAVAHRMRVPRGWTPMKWLRASQNAPLKLPRRGRIPVAEVGVNMRPVDHPDGELRFFPKGDGLEVVARLGSAVLITSESDALLYVPGHLPEPILVALVGRPIDEVAPHPVLSGRGYTIEDAHVDPVRGATVLLFRAGRLPHAMPWKDSLRRALRRVQWWPGEESHKIDLRRTAAAATGYGARSTIPSIAGRYDSES